MSLTRTWVSMRPAFFMRRCRWWVLGKHRPTKTAHVTTEKTDTTVVFCRRCGLVDIQTRTLIRQTGYERFDFITTQPDVFKKM
jgi:hypothetical protein